MLRAQLFRHLLSHYPLVIDPLRAEQRIVEFLNDCEVIAATVGASPPLRSPRAHAEDAERDLGP